MQKWPTYEIKNSIEFAVEHEINWRVLSVKSEIKFSQMTHDFQTWFISMTIRDINDLPKYILFLSTYLGVCPFSAFLADICCDDRIISPFHFALYEFAQGFQMQKG